jgi:tRNA A37 threonylcarbamoyladenosine dehydratase
MQAFSKEENELFRNKSVAVIGCGGLGGYIIEMLARLGIGNITVVDGDVFNETNLNRQLYSSPNVIGKNKALIAKNRIIKILIFSR